MKMVILGPSMGASGGVGKPLMAVQLISYPMLLI